MSTAFEINSLKKTYGRRVILDIAGAEFAKGEIVAIVGPNGCGKTTLLECLNGLSRPDAGVIKAFGAPISLSARRRMTLVSQSPYLFNSTVRYNIEYGLRTRGKTDPEAVKSALETVGMSDYADRRARSLSGGEAKRVAVARAIAFSPDALLLDEPTANVDDKNIAAIENTARVLCREKGAAVVIATHDREQAVRIADRIFLIHDGDLIPFHPDNHFVAELTESNGEKVLLFGDTLRAVVSTPKATGPVSCTIPPDEIIVSDAPIKSSARNCWEGTVTGISLENGRVRITVNPGVPVVATVTKASFDALKPTIGSKLYITFKASSILVF